MAQNQESAAYLVFQQGSLAGKRVELWKECTTIGRSRARDIFLEDVTVHRKQASILRTAQGYVLRDDHGSGDSLVNGQPVREHLLQNGDRLTFGNTQLTFYASEATRPFQFPSSRGRELLIGRSADPATGPITTPIARLDLSGPHGGNLRSIELLSEISIGRSRECNIFLEDLAVSRLHATVSVLPDGSYELADNGSATGTFVNGRAITRCHLHDGDIIQIGAQRFVFHLSKL
ncbi:MAG: FHA domain-containing protein [Ktedonobacteraceae bacterium]|nr:FHA domain-containing protein [Ktedonobacteraceae bacterium]